MAVHSAEQLAAAPAAAGGSQAAAAPAAAAGGSQAAVAGGSQGNGFIAVRSAQQSAPPVLANVQQLDEEVEIRGVCDGCGEYVMSNDEGRKREDDKYYHAECIKGRCGGCRLIVHALDERVRLSGVYWHHDCDSDRAESSRAGAERARQEQSHS